MKSKSTVSRKHVLQTVRDLRRAMEFMGAVNSPLTALSDENDKAKIFWWKRGYQFALDRLRDIA